MLLEDDGTIDEKVMVVARQQRLAWAKAGIHRRLATSVAAAEVESGSTTNHAAQADQHDGGQTIFSPAFQWLSDDLVSEIGRRMPPIFRQTPADQAAVAAADPRLQRVYTEAEATSPGSAGRQNCVLQ